MCDHLWEPSSSLGQLFILVLTDLKVNVQQGANYLRECKRHTARVASARYAAPSPRGRQWHADEKVHIVHTALFRLGVFS